MLKPRLGGTGWTPLFTPRKSGSYVNDHCVIRGPGDRRHVFAISKDTPDIAPHQERWFCHGSGKSLAQGAFTEHGRVCDFGARLAAHAPEYLTDPETGQWYITSAGWPDERLGTVIPGSVAIRELDWVDDI